MARRKKPREPEPQAAAEEEFQVVGFREADGSVPLLEWLDGLESPDAVLQCLGVLMLLKRHANRLVRPHADALRDSIRELRARVGRVQYRMFYFFHKRGAVVTHGCIKPGRETPPREIDRAIAYRQRFLADPVRHTYQEL